jgi:hypothetical protein
MSTFQAPPWFTSERYSFPLPDARTWLFRLKRAAYFTAPDWQKDYEECRGDFNLPELPEQFDPDFPVSRDYIPPAAVVALDAPQEADLHDSERPALLLKVSLSAPDDVIMHEFKRILRGVRGRCPAPVRQPGRQVLNGRFKKEQFTTWRNYKILELADLLAWRAYDKIDATDAQLGRLLEMGNANLKFDPKRTVMAKKELFRAIDSISALAAQVASEARQEA